MFGSMGGQGHRGNGHFYFAQTGHSHFAATLNLDKATLDAVPREEAVIMPD
jgi:hypothetical protein